MEEQKLQPVPELIYGDLVQETETNTVTEAAGVKTEDVRMEDENKNDDEERDYLRVFHSSLVSAGLADVFEDGCWKHIKTDEGPEENFLNVVRVSVAKKQKGAAPSTELGRYSGTDYTSTMSADDIDSFDILAWWKGRETEFPVLSAMDRDLLSSQTSTVASESAFSTCGRVISLRRTRLSTEAVEMCICLKNHLDAVDRIQHLTSLEDGIEPE
ncbi:hypothetical protein QVD17_30328 [Tagetes erecta]|uniref:HAT C-terminal dimerisation domain-containing protein n=1 Tax=Tagetes erecta TaxID=13708 RepID=A0AAD8K567_TARER|nr:hypothetical protein QVD17_30328 [Tagetes erecta]